jgi:hypothetical protein
MFLQSIYQPRKALYLIKKSGTQSKGGWVGYRAVKDILENGKICYISSHYRTFASLRH